MESDRTSDESGGKPGEKPGEKPRIGRLREDSWVDAVVTILATVIFGLGWALVELERAEPPANRYDAAVSTIWVAAVTTSIEARATEAGATERTSVATVDRRRNGDASWTELALERSNR